MPILLLLAFVVAEICCLKHSTTDEHGSIDWDSDPMQEYIYFKRSSKTIFNGRRV